MHIIDLTPLAPGVYNDHKPDHITSVPEGWAYIPTADGPIPEEWKGTERDYSLPSTFPRLGSIKAEELTYTREVEVQKEVTKTREVPQYDEQGNMLTVMRTEEYTEMETVMETREYTMMTVVSMSEGTLPEPVPETPTQLDQIEAQVTYTAMMTDTLLEV